VQTVIADVSDIDSVNTATLKALSQFKTIDILINNAGIAAFEKIPQLEPKSLGKYNSGKLNGNVLCNKGCLPNMIERQTGDIININRWIK
jgi:3-oxoacyl-[acyl-carrier protein] reductase